MELMILKHGEMFSLVAVLLDFWYFTPQITIACVMIPFW